MRFTRSIDEHLNVWKRSSDRKPLLLRGARQVGKTFAIREFSKKYDQYIELNLEKSTHRELFELDDVGQILGKAQILEGQLLGTNGTSLLFIDEIQEEPRAINMLRYFHEERPDIHVVAAGSLLEFALSETAGFPVGRVEFMYMHPMSFEEYLIAAEEAPAFDSFKKLPCPDFAIKPLLGLFNEYVMVGGMPGVLKNYLRDKNPALLSQGYRKLWEVYAADAEKYARTPQEQKIIRHILKYAFHYLEPITFAQFAKSEYRSKEVKEAFMSLDKARLIRLLYPSISLQVPVVPSESRRPKLQFLDTGMLNHSLGLQGELLGIKDLESIHRGKILEHIVRQEIMSIYHHSDYLPMHWVREKHQSSAELDILYRHKGKVIPIEVKSGKSGKLKSLHQFLDLSDSCRHAIRLYSGPLKIEQHITNAGTHYKLLNLPYFLASEIPAYIDWFMDE